MLNLRPDSDVIGTLARIAGVCAPANRLAGREGPMLLPDPMPDGPLAPAGMDEETAMRVRTALILALPLSLSLGLFQGTAFAQYSGTTPQYANAAAQAPRIDGFDVEPAKRLTTGNTLAFTLYGTPGGWASVSIPGVAARILLDETEAGVYERTYTIGRADRVDGKTPATANLRVGNKVATSILDESLLAGAPSPSARAAAAAAITPKIERFDVDAPSRRVTGEQIFFTLYGTPGGRASARIAGVKGKLVMDEVRTGVYEGAYTIKDRDRVAVDARATATLMVGNKGATSIFNGPAAGATAPVSAQRSAARVCANCGVVEAVNLVEVKGEGTYLGKIAGGVVGGLIGSQIGGGHGTTVAEIAGVVGGAVAGNEIEKRVKKSTHYDVVTRLQGGGMQTVTYATAPPFSVGDKVRVEGGLLVADK